MSKFNIPKFEFTGLIVYILILIVVFFTELLLGKVPFDRLLLYLSVIFGIIVCSTISGFLVFRDVFSLTEKTDQLHKGIQELYKQSAILVSNEALKEYESKANFIRIISPDLYNDQNSFYQTVLTNLKSNKVYQYIIPDNPELIDKMHSLITHLGNEAGIKKGKGLKLYYRAVSNFPILTEYVLYDGNSFGELRGFMEIRAGSKKIEYTNLPLREKETHIINNYFDKMFQE